MSLKQPPGPSQDVIGAIGSGIAALIYPQALYSFGFQDVINHDVSGAKRIGWRFTGQLADVDVSIDVRDDSLDKPSALTSFGYGRRIAAARKTLRDVTASDEVKDHDYELRLLAIPGLRVEAVWLQSQSGTPDLIYPYLKPAAWSDRPVPMTLDEFLTALAPAAKKAKAFDKSRHGWPQAAAAVTGVQK